ncbi:hypothetical protein [Anaerostipes sp.]|uniref:hypothetical protein n=1 Tax=Anaerostipes sp. TaxID=1872530 RepID=UPI0039944006
MKIIRYKNNFVFFIMISLFLVGCQREKEHLSDMFDLKNDKLAGVYDPEYSSTIVQNEQFVFYETENQEIVRINKKNHKRTTIISPDEKSEVQSEGGLELSKDSLYYVHNNCVFKSDLNGKNIQRLLSAKEKKETEWINGIKIYNNEIYLLADGEWDNSIFRFYPKSKKLEKVAEDIRNPCFSGNNLYYIEHGEVGINKVDLKTLKGKIVRGQAWKNKLQYEDDLVRYKGIVENEGRVYYICWGKDDKVRLYQYRDHKKDTIQHGFSDNSDDFVYNSSIIVGFNTHWDTSEERYIQIYNLDSKQEKKIKMPNDTWSAEFVIDDMVVCTYLYDNGEFGHILKLDI